MFILFKCKYEDETIKTLHRGVIVDHTQLETYYQYLVNVFAFKNNDYRDKDVIEVIIEFFPISPDSMSKYLTKWQPLAIASTPTRLQEFKGDGFNVNLPVNNLYESWGNIVNKTK